VATAAAVEARTAGGPGRVGGDDDEEEEEEEEENSEGDTPAPGDTAIDRMPSVTMAEEPAAVEGMEAD
jgi:hypothetical protein